MDKILYLTETKIVLLDVSNTLNPLATTKEVAWSDWDKIEETISELSPTENVSVIMDFIDDTHHLHWGSKLYPWEKKAYENRQEEKAHTEGAMFAKLLWLDTFRKTEEGRVEQALMISNVFSNAKLEALFTLFEEAEVSVKALYSYVFLLESYFLKQLAPKLKLSKRDLTLPMMLVFRESRFNFRQILFNYGRLNISRHIELDHELENDEAIEKALLHETKVTVKYLYNQKTIPVNSEVSFVYINSHDQGEDGVVKGYVEEVALANWDTSRYYVVASDLYTLNNAKSEGESLYSTLGFLTQYLHKSKPRTFYRHAFVDKILRYTQIQKMLWLLAVCVFLVGGYVTLTLAVDDYLLNYKNIELNQKLSGLNVKKNRLQKLVKLKYDAKDIKSSVEFSESLLQLKTVSTAGFDVEALSQVLNRHPHIALSTLAWQKQDAIDSANVLVTLTGWVFPFHDAYEKPVQWVDELVKDLEAQATVRQVNLIKGPLDRSLKKSLVISGTSDEEINVLPFKLTMLVGEKH